MRDPGRRFYFFLAEKLGCTVGELLSRISSSELIEWAAHFHLTNEESKSAGKRTKETPKITAMGRGR
ncbi:MAG: hypothetical protein MUP73_05480 [Dehalococcoidia bacterium]|nr:hypothetical protein [Dehalococcoidia bacterium]